jgi:spore germination protein YaaH
MRVLVLACCVASACSQTAPSSLQEESIRRPEVIWTSLRNTAVYGELLTKSGGLDQQDDAGASSFQKLDGDGWLEVTLSETQAFRFVGLTHAGAGDGAAEIDYAFRVQAGRADAYENGQWRADNTVVEGDRVRISVSAGQVTFAKNDVAFYTSATPAVVPLVAQASLIDATATIYRARLSAATHVASTPADAGAPPADLSPTDLAPRADLGHAVADLSHATDLSHPAADLARPADLAQPPMPDLAQPPVANRHRFCGWTLATGNVTPDQDPGYTTFAAHAAEFDAVHPVWWHVSGTTGFARIYGEGDPTIASHTTAAGQRTLLIPMIAAVDGSDPGSVSTMLHDATLRAQHIANLVTLVTSHGYDGIDLDYEHLPDTDRAALSTYTQEAASALHAQHRTISLAVAGITSPAGLYDYDALSAAADQLHVMAYDYHFLGSHPGPVAPREWVRNIVTYIGTIAGGARNGKFILGMPNYGVAGPDGSPTTWFGTSQESLALAGAGYATTTTHMLTCPFLDGVPLSGGLAPNATTAQGHLYFDDLASLEEKVALAQTGNLGGVTYWTIGGEPTSPTRTFFQMVRSHFPQ